MLYLQATLIDGCLYNKKGLKRKNIDVTILTNIFETIGKVCVSITLGTWKPIEKSVFYKPCPHYFTLSESCCFGHSELRMLHSHYSQTVFL